MKTLVEALADVRVKVELQEKELARLRAVMEYLQDELGKQAEPKPRMTAFHGMNGNSQRGLTQIEAAQRVLMELGRAAKISQIADMAIERGWITSKASEKNIRNSLY